VDLDIKNEDGSVYKGYFLNGDKEGHGVLESDSFIYDVMWSRDLKSGDGTFTIIIFALSLYWYMEK